ncbi:metalloregulator ArsR/SmtB family transcription factor [Oceanicoccus sp. KOV_DT_Chl]|uniref:metalloregulator ArsR/SmtB family transcription factor n=1 Tax=Oceanicoccus sp. KOV_DT_Chl TaxID=1904639 RepID=UPI0035109097
MSPVQLFKCLADDTRLNAILLIQQAGELCVCELMAALDDSQPKISRHLAQLRNCGLLLDERRGQWVFYRINPALPDWAHAIFEQAVTAREENLHLYQTKLTRMSDRPSC